MERQEFGGGKKVLAVADLKSAAVKAERDVPNWFVPDDGNRILKGQPYYIDDRCMRPGHILLSASRGKTAEVIRRYQEKIESEDHSLWSHVAIFGANRCVWEIIPGDNVRRVSFSEFVADKDLLSIRRIRDVEVDVGKLEGNISLQAKAKYPPMNLATFAIYRKNLRKLQHGMPDFGKDEYNCSLFVDRIIRATLNMDPCPGIQSAIILPANFAASKCFEDILLGDFIYRFE